MELEDELYHQSIREKDSTASLKHLQNIINLTTVLTALQFRYRVSSANEILQLELKSYKYKLQTRQSPSSIFFSLNTIAALYNELGLYKDVKKIHRQVLRLQNQNQKVNVEIMANSLNQLGLVYSQEKNYKKAKQTLEKALSMKESLRKKLSDDPLISRENGEVILSDFSIAKTLRDLAAVHQQCKDFENAQKALEREFKILQENEKYVSSFGTSNSSRLDEIQKELKKLETKKTSLSNLN